MSFVNLEGVVKRYGDLTAVDGISLDIKKGEFVSILGPSGSGKTTTLRLVAGFEDVTEGNISIDGQNMIGVKPEDRNLSMVFQRLALFPHLTVYENIAFGLRLRTDPPESKIETKVENALDLVEMGGYQERNIQELSGGEQQRVALARSIVVEPDVILFDEPLSDLDRRLREHLRKEIGKIHDRLKITTIYVTHNQREALTLADRVALMNDGEVVQFDTPSEIYANPNSLFAANFMGDANVIEGEVETVQGNKVFKNEFIQLPLSNNISPSTNTLIVRPEDIKVGSSSGETSIEAKIQSVRNLGSTTEYEAQVSDYTFQILTLGLPDFSVGDETMIEITEYKPISGE